MQNNIYWQLYTLHSITKINRVNQYKDYYQWAEGNALLRVCALSDHVDLSILVFDNAPIASAKI